MTVTVTASWLRGSTGGHRYRGAGDADYPAHGGIDFWAFDLNATLAAGSLPGLVSASGRAVRRASPPP